MKTKRNTEAMHASDDKVEIREAPTVPGVVKEGVDIIFDKNRNT